MTYRVLDLCCKAGGVSKGLKNAWPDAEIYGVDIEPQPHYPYHFILADALTVDLNGYDFYWASPPCQAYSQMTGLAKYKGIARDSLALIAPIRSRLVTTGKPYVIENVSAAKDDMFTLIELCGSMFNLGVWRHRRFESNRMLLQPPHDRREHERIYNEGRYCCVVGMGGQWRKRQGSRSTEDWKREMGIDWMDRYELTQAIPPAYSEYIARQIRAFVPECKP